MTVKGLSQYFICPKSGPRSLCGSARPGQASPQVDPRLRTPLFPSAPPSGLLEGSFSWIRTKWHSFSWALSILIFIYILEGATLSCLLDFTFLTSSAWKPSSPGKLLLLPSRHVPLPWKPFFSTPFWWLPCLMLLQHAVLSYHCTVVLCGAVGLACWPVCHPTIRSVRVELSCLLWYSSAQCCAWEDTGI